MKAGAAALAFPAAGCLDGNGNDSMNGDGALNDGSNGGMQAMDPAGAPRASIDRFSDKPGTLMRRSQNSALPGPDEPIDFDQPPFITRGLGPQGERVEYYNFDVQPTAPAPIYVLFREGMDTPVEGQLNIVDVVPGDTGYNDFWRVHRVTVPEGYEVNTVTSAQDIQSAGYEVMSTDTLVNCPVVPEGSTASKRYGDRDPGLVQGWYRGQVVTYFEFSEASLAVSGGGVPTSPIYVAFNRNPSMEGGGPASGFVTEDGSTQTHNVLATLPGDQGYSPLWTVTVYDNRDFPGVGDLESARDADILTTGAANVNCPVVSVMEAMTEEDAMSSDRSTENESMEDGSMDGGGMEGDGSMDGGGY